MKTSTACNHLNKFKTRLHDSYSQYRSHAQIIEQRRKTIYDTAEWKRCPQWVRHHIDGMSEEQLNTAHRHLLTYCIYESKDGMRYNSWDAIPEEIKEKIRSSEINTAETGFHYWTKTGVKF